MFTLSFVKGGGSEMDLSLLCLLMYILRMQKSTWLIILWSKHLLSYLELCFSSFNPLNSFYEEDIISPLSSFSTETTATFRECLVTRPASVS